MEHLLTDGELLVYRLAKITLTKPWNRKSGKPILQWTRLVDNELKTESTFFTEGQAMFEMHKEFEPRMMAATKWRWRHEMGTARMGRRSKKPLC